MFVAPANTPKDIMQKLNAEANKAVRDPELRATLSAQGVELTGSTPEEADAIAEDAAAYCRERGLRVSTGIADEANLAQLGMMDVIVLLDVIEHLPSPHETLALCARVI
jgi:2-polyprenyl-3-methyl-5-hydroxy-6-metoxy-1,4-benzoquinol methylase